MDNPFNLDPDLISLGDSGHGGDVWSAARNLGVPVSEILDLSASLNPLGQPPGLAEVVAQAMDLVCHYPDRNTLELRQALAGALGVTPANILPGNGSTALIRVVARAMDLHSIVVMAPVFGEFARSLAITGRHFSYLILKEKNGFAPTAQDLDRLWDMEPSCVILSNPVTPAGGLVAPEVLQVLLAQAHRRRVWVVLDEAFIDFAPREAREWSPALLERYPRLLVLRSLTKFYCLAGLRLGFAMGHADTMADLAPLAQAWSVNTLAQKAGVYCLGLDDYARQTRLMVDQWRQQQEAALKDLGLKVLPSQANYLLCRLPEDGPTADLVAQATAGKGVLVRACGNFVGCSPYHLRTAVCTPQEQERLLQVLKPALGMWLFGGSPK
ncbi:MAG: histidinol-phosphate aminotransferase family protein [Desulfarculus sp.]|nr:histidinol-phosphate aminotransferase family protein [Desulfarculus sp.]